MPGSLPQKTEDFTIFGPVAARPIVKVVFGKEVSLYQVTEAAAEIMGNCKVECRRLKKEQPAAEGGRARGIGLEKAAA